MDKTVGKIIRVLGESGAVKKSYNIAKLAENIFKAISEEDSKEEPKHMVTMGRGERTPASIDSKNPLLDPMIDVDKI